LRAVTNLDPMNRGLKPDPQSMDRLVAVGLQT